MDNSPIKLQPCQSIGGLKNEMYIIPLDDVATIRSESLLHIEMLDEAVMSDTASKLMKQADEKILSFFEPYLREAGIKGEITKSKMKWRGIKMKVQNDLGSCKYQLNQRGVDISPVFTVEFSMPLNYR